MFYPLAAVAGEAVHGVAGVGPIGFEVLDGGDELGG